MCQDSPLPSLFKRSDSHKLYVGGGFKDFLFSSLFGEMIFKWVETTNQISCLYFLSARFSRGCVGWTAKVQDVEGLKLYDFRRGGIGRIF